MLDLADCLQDLVTALEDNSLEHQSWFDPDTGQVEFYSDYYDSEDDSEDPEERGLLLVRPVQSHEAYRDMEDFIAQVGDPRAHDLLERAIAGRGAFRRFKDTLFEFPELRDAWFALHDTRMEYRALEWLADEGVITREQAQREIAARPEPSLPAPPLDARAIARAVARDLRALYGERLKDVILFGSQARGDATPESDIDLLVVLDEVPSRRRELARMSRVMGDHSLDNDTVVTEVPVSAREWRDSSSPAIMRARAEGVSVT